MIIIQHICTKWTKASRGAPQSRLRNQVPKVKKIIGNPLQSDAIYIDQYVADEKDNFVLKNKFYLLEQSGRRDEWYDHLCFHFEENSWRFFYYEGLLGIGGPNRANQTLFNLKLNQWGCLLINNRIAGTVGAYGPILYSQDVYNIVNIQNFRSDIFIATKPNYCINKLENLF